VTVNSAQFNGIAITAQQDLFELVAPALKAVQLLMVKLTQTTEVGDAQEENLSILFKKGQTTSGSGGATGVTAVNLRGETAGTAAIETNNTTKATVGTILTFDNDVWYERSPFLWVPPTEKLIPLIPPGVRMTVELATTPADSITANGVIYWEEIG
jgi:hypothetical protein